MFVEGDVSLQAAFRDRLKRNGYRVLMFSDPQRALSRFGEELKPADVVVFSTSEIGDKALGAFNSFTRRETTSTVPAILLLAENHAHWREHAELSDLHVAITMPITLRQLRERLAALLNFAQQFQ